MKVLFLLAISCNIAFIDDFSLHAEEKKDYKYTDKEIKFMEGILTQLEPAIKKMEEYPGSYFYWLQVDLIFKRYIKQAQRDPSISVNAVKLLRMRKEEYKKSYEEKQTYSEEELELIKEHPFFDLEIIKIKEMYSLDNQHLGVERLQKKLNQIKERQKLLKKTTSTKFDTMKELYEVLIEEITGKLTKLKKTIKKREKREKETEFINNLRRKIDPINAKTCTNYDLRTKSKKHTGPMAHIPVMSQQGGTCYAHAAANVLTSYLHGLNIKKYKNTLVDPLFAAILYTLKRTKPDERDGRIISGGWICNTIEALKKYGACDRKYFEKFYKKFKTPDVKKIKKANANKKGQLILLDHMKKYFDKFQKIQRKKSFWGFQSSSQAKLIKQKEESIAGQTRRCLARYIGIKIDLLPDVKKIIKVMTEKKLSKFYYELFFKSVCPENKRLTKVLKTLPPCKGNDFGWYSRITSVQKKLNEVINRVPKRAIGIDYCSTVLYKEKYRGIRRYTIKAIEQDPNYLCNLHASVIIGRKRDKKGRCFYLVRNSWGNKCHNITNKNIECKDGDFWISSESLLPNLHNLEYL